MYHALCHNTMQVVKFIIILILLYYERLNVKMIEYSSKARHGGYRVACAQREIKQQSLEKYTNFILAHILYYII